MRKDTEYPYGEVAQHGMCLALFVRTKTTLSLAVFFLDSDIPAVLSPEMGPPPPITITGVEDAVSIRTVGSMGGASSSRHSPHAGFVGRGVELERVEKGMHSDFPPAYTP